LTATELSELLGARSRQLKPLLMDQSVIAGLGNIYACEILWSAALSPFRPAQSLKIDDYRRLAESLSEVLARAIAAGGATLDDYRNTNGAMGDFDLSFSVYGRERADCARCGNPIATEHLGGRVTYWCAGCQI
jgi:formamidopyrimidine-DNA glycosylase